MKQIYSLNLQIFAVAIILLTASKHIYAFEKPTISGADSLKDMTQRISGSVENGEDEMNALNEFMIKDEATDGLNNFRSFIRNYDGGLISYDYWRATDRFKLYEDGNDFDWIQSRQDLINDSRNTQHYDNNQFLIREGEFRRMTEDRSYRRKKEALVVLNHLLTGNINSDHVLSSPHLMLKSEDKLLKNNSLNLMHKIVGTGDVKKEPGQFALDVHVHTYQSFDGTSDMETLLLTAYKKGFGAIVITDHDYFDDSHQAIAAAERLKAAGNLPREFVVIPGMEISSRDGHILGLYIKSYIAHGLTAEQTIDEIHRQGGLAIAPHPYQPDFGVGGKLVKNLAFDGMVVTGMGPEFRMSLSLAEDVNDRMAIFMDSDTHVENGLAWMGYTAVHSDDQSSDGVYRAIQERKTAPVHQNVMKYQRNLADNKLGKTIVSPIVTLTNMHYHAERHLSDFLLADRVEIHGILTDMIDDVAGLSLGEFGGYDYFSGGHRFYPLRGVSAYYGPVRLGLRRDINIINIDFGFKVIW
ncbi:MAG: PHP domain-containing protein [Calditrichaceae bacterium]